MITIWIISVLAYLFVGGVINGLDNEPEEKIYFIALLFWPIVVVMWLGDKFGQFLRRSLFRK